MALTDPTIRAAGSRDRPYKVTDGGGLFLLVSPSGKYWRQAYRFAGKQRTLAIGTYPAIGLKEARGRRDKAKELLEQGQKAPIWRSNAPSAPE